MLPAEWGDYRGVYVLKLRLDGAGFGAMILQTLNQLRYCEREGYLPVVNYDASCRSFYLEPSMGPNMWSQYFEPVLGDFSFEAIERFCADPNHPLTAEDLVTLSDEAMLQITEHHPESVYSYTFADWRLNPPEDLNRWYAEQRCRGRETVARYIRILPHILAKVEAFWKATYPEGPVLGVHVRGTDLMYAPPVSPAEYFPHIDAWLQENPGGRLFLATDQRQYLDVFKRRYAEKVAWFDCVRSIDATPTFGLKGVSPYKKGEDVLCDILLLARTSFVLKGGSNVGEMALYFNPDLTCQDLCVRKRFAFGQDYGTGWNGGLIEHTKPAWELIGKTNLEQVDASAARQSAGERWRYRVRPLWMFALKPFRRGVRFLRRVLGGDK